MEVGIYNLIPSIEQPYITMAIETPELESIIKGIDQIIKGNLVNTFNAIEASTTHVQGIWIQNASGTTVSYNGQNFVIHRRSGKYVNSIQNGFIYPVQSNPLHGRVEANVPYALYIERGRAARSGAEVRASMLASPKAKVSKEGFRYVTVPFRHASPGAGKVGGMQMPKDVYDKAKALKPSVIGFVRGGTLKLPHYGQMSKITAGGHYTWKSGPYHGMKRFEASSEKQKSQGQQHSGYLTFRRVSEKTPSSSEAWAQPEVPPRPVAAASAKMAMHTVINTIRAGVIADIKGLISM